MRTFRKKWLTVSIHENGMISCTLVDENSYPHTRKQYSGMLSQIHDDSFVLSFRMKEYFGQRNAISSYAVTEGSVEISVPEG